MMQGKDVLITGGTAGIGRAAATALARLGASVTVMGRDFDRSRAAAAEIEREAGAGRVAGLACDLSSLTSVRRTATDFAAGHPKLDVLALNAGAFFAKREVSDDGHEKTFAMGYLGQFLLTELLLPSLKAAPEGRVIATGVPASSMKVNLDGFALEQGYHSFKAVPNVTSARAMYMLDLADRMRGTGVTANFFHPGIIRTDLFAQMPWVMRVFLRIAGAPPAKGADTLVYLASSPEVKGVTGGYFHKRKQGTVSGPLTDRATWSRLRELSLKLTGLPG